MNIIFSHRNTNSFTGRYTPLQRANSLLFDELGQDVSKVAHQSGIPKSMVLILMERTDTKNKEKLANVLVEQFKGIFNLITRVKDISALKEILKVPENIVKHLLKCHKRVLKEQQLITSYMSDFISIEKFSRKQGMSPSAVGEIFSKWDVPNSVERSHKIMRDGFEKRLKSSDIASLAHVNEESVSRYRKQMNLLGKRESNKVERNPEIVQRLLNGESRKIIAKEYGLVKATIDRIAQDNDVVNIKTKKRNDTVIARIKEGVLYKDVAKEFNISVDTVKRIARKYRNKKDV